MATRRKTKSQKTVTEVLVLMVALGVIVSQAYKANSSDPLIIGAALAMLGLVPASRMDDIRNKLTARKSGERDTEDDVDA